MIQFVPTCCSPLRWRATETMQITWSGEFMFALLWLVLVLSLGAISPAQPADSRWQRGQRRLAVLSHAATPYRAFIAWAIFGGDARRNHSGMVIAVAGVALARR